MTTENDNFATMNENDGEEVDFADVNNAQLFLGARINDQLLAKLIPLMPNGLEEGDPTMQGEYGKSVGTFTGGSTTTLARAFCLTPGGGYVWVGSSDVNGKTLGANVVGIAPGTLCQLTGDDDTGTDAKLLLYTFSGSESVSIAANSSGNPRVDLIEMALSYVQNGSQSRDFEDATTGANTSVSVNKQRQVQCIYQVKQGTPAASPVMPTPDAGFCAIGAVVVNNGYATSTQIIAGIDTGGANAVLHDLRVPIGKVSTYAVPAAAMLTASGWALGGTYNDQRAPGGTGVTLWAPLQQGLYGRCLGFGLVMEIPSGGTPTCQIGKLSYSGGSYTFTELANAPDVINTGTLGHSQYYALEPIDLLESQMAPSAGPTVVADSTAQIGPPLWATGLRTPARPFEQGLGASPNHFDQLCVQIQSGAGVTSGMIVWKVVFFIAEGL